MTQPQVVPAHEFSAIVLHTQYHTWRWFSACDEIEPKPKAFYRASFTYLWRMLWYRDAKLEDMSFIRKEALKFVKIVDLLGW